MREGIDEEIKSHGVKDKRGMASAFRTLDVQPGSAVVLIKGIRMVIMNQHDHRGLGWTGPVQGGGSKK